MVKPDTCRICNHRPLATVLSGIQSQFGEIYSLKQCKVCSFVSTSPLPSAETLKKYYGQDYWQPFNGKTAKLLSFFYKLRMLSVLRNIKRTIPQNGHILDWGSGDGSLIRLLEHEGFDCYGIDNYHVELTNKKLVNTTIIKAPFSKDFFDCITSFHVLEHIEKPFASIKKAFHLLKPNGILVVEVPNIESVSFQIFKNNWYHLDIPLHLNHFNLSVMKWIFNKIGNNKIIKVNYFSHRHSPSSVVNSLIPSLSPRNMRARYSGQFPLPLMMLYLFLQILSYPFPMIEALIRRGEILRIYIKKTP